MTIQNKEKDYTNEKSGESVDNSILETTKRTEKFRLA